MSCCKDNLLLYLKIEDHQKQDTAFLSKIETVLLKELDYSEEQVKAAVNYAVKKDRCLVLEGSKEEVSKITMLFAESGIGAEVENKSMK